MDPPSFLASSREVGLSESTKPGHVLKISRYPGPLLAKISDAYWAIYVYRGDSHVNLYKLHQKHGEQDKSDRTGFPLLLMMVTGRIVRIGPSTLSFRSATALKDIYGHGSTLVKKDDFYAAFSAVPGIYNTHNATSKVEHARKRRVMSHAFSETALRGMENLMIKHVESFCGYLETLQGPKDMAKWYNYLTYDVMGGQYTSVKFLRASRH